MSRKMSVLLAVALALLSVAIAPVMAQDEFVFGMVLVGPKDDMAGAKPTMKAACTLRKTCRALRCWCSRS